MKGDGMIWNERTLNIDHLGTVRLEPFLEYARKLLRERPNSTKVAHASGLLARQGTKEDLELLEKLLEQDPFSITDVTKDVKALRERLNPPQPEIRPVRRDRPSATAEITVDSADRSENRPQKRDPTSSLPRPWLIGGLILVMLLFYPFVRKLRGRKDDAPLG